MFTAVGYQNISNKERDYIDIHWILSPFRIGVDLGRKTNIFFIIPYPFADSNSGGIDSTWEACVQSFLSNRLKLLDYKICLEKFRKYNIFSIYKVFFII